MPPSVADFLPDAGRKLLTSMTRITDEKDLSNFIDRLMFPLEYVLYG
jgi:hypothetical protein